MAQEAGASPNNAFTIPWVSSVIVPHSDAVPLDTGESQPAMTAAVCVRDVRKAYGAVQAVRGISMELHTGRITALLGHNGAGKSTLVGVITGEGLGLAAALLLSG